MECTSFHDVIVEEKNKEEAIDRAYVVSLCPQNGMEFGEFLEIEEEDEVT